jgi:energy-coupling factor transporter ATP-binding protein EcfA2
MKRTVPLNSGSRWVRWEPHIHAPGTVLNDQFKRDCWEAYLLKLEGASPEIRALGITDYYSKDLYERVCAEKNKGRLPKCDLVFPNIEMRLAIATVRDKWVNVHLLVDPLGTDHIPQLKRFLQNLAFKAHGDTYRCNKDDLIRLGQRADNKLTDPAAALHHGSEQFKVLFDELQKAYRESDWAKQNVLIAVAGGSTDGTSGVREGADATLRQEVEKFAHIIFASSAVQREFWLGRKVLSPKQIRARYGGLKPCMHGSDAHDLATVAMPADNRFCWIKGDAAFDTLRQACIDPAGRAYVGEEPPLSAMPSQVIAAVEIKDAPWAATPLIDLNPGLVTIIGARGSGKTALVDAIALGCDATEGRLTEASFLTRAGDLLGNASVSLRWLEGNPSERMMDGSELADADEYPRAQYLSQKFVEHLCSADGMTDELLSEIERVIFESHSAADRDGAADFNELRELRTFRFREARARDEEALADISERIGTELEKRKLVEGLKKQVVEKHLLVEKYTADRSKLVPKDSEARVDRLNAIMTAAETVRGYLRYYATQEQSLLTMQDEVTNYRAHGAPEALRRMSERHKASALKPEEWESFLLDYTGEVDDTVGTHLRRAREQSAIWRGQAIAGAADAKEPFIANDAVLDAQSLALLEAETARLEKLINLDQEARRKFAALSKRISDETTTLNKLKVTLADCEGAKGRATQLVAERENAYRRVFEAIVAEEGALKVLYAPLMARLAGATGTLTKLSFSVVRIADTTTWAKAGEEHLDLRLQGNFRGRGTLEQLANEDLKTPWEAGDADRVSAAMKAFREKNQEALLDDAPVPKSQQANYRDWLKTFAKWLYGTDHIQLQYSIDYDAVDIRKLSPGTRGIVLLLLYLALDDADDRPLIIDQPEENLDPKSIFDELVSLFLEAKTKRQVIMVTHNANLVVNTDADQVIIAQAQVIEAGQLPEITYTSGGLERADIREAVCNILEGGEEAFRERARRLRVSLAH